MGAEHVREIVRDLWEHVTRWQWRQKTQEVWLFVMHPHFSRNLQSIIDMRITLNYRRIFLLLLALGVVLYSIPVIFRRLRGGRPAYYSWPSGCLQEKLEEFKESIHSFDSSLHYDEVESSYFPFTGNGYIAMGVSDLPSSKLVIRQGRVFETVPYFPMVSVDVRSSRPLTATAATVMEFKTGIVHLLQSFGDTSSRCVQVNRRVVAHRRIPNLLVETLDMYNPSSEDVDISMSLQTNFGPDFGAVIVNGQTRDSQVVTGTVESQNGQKTMIAIARPKLSESNRITLKTGGRLARTLYTVISYYSLGEKDNSLQTKNSLIDEVQDLYKSLPGQQIENLLKGHALVWDSLWKSGFGISNSKAAGAYNGDKINATAYYALCLERASNQEIQPTENQLVLKKPVEAPLTPGHCYAGHNTLQASLLWSDFRSVEEIVRVANLWRLTLTKQGCGSFLALGAEGYIQAFILSLGGFRYSSYDHLEMLYHPQDLHRNFDFRRIAYGSVAHLNISVRVGEETDNKPVLLVAVDRSDKTFYACDAGCLDPPVPLTKDMQEFPVKLTDPLTAILYITSDKEHMEDLKHTLHLRNIHEADPHPHHVLAEHKHGHSLGGLPALFWISIALLVALFHVFLIRIVVNEYFNQDSISVPVRSRGTRYTA